MTLRKFAVVAAALVAGSLSGLAASAETTRPVTIEPVRGAWTGSSSWSEISARLEAASLHITAVQNPPASLADSSVAPPPNAGEDSGAARHAVHSAARVFTGRGAQVYRCQDTGSVYAWVLKGPDAQLFNAAGQVVGRHFFGPRWQANDGSRVAGQLLIASISPDGRGNVPWLVLRAHIEQADGIFGRVRIITRTDTHGGVAPTATCGPQQNGQAMNEAYSATYTFFS